MTSVPLHHRLRRIQGRDPGEPHRASSPLELLFDLTFVIAFGATSTQLAHAIAGGHTASGLLAFGFSTFAVSWAWINYSWWASAFDTDDWYVRLMTLVQMVGVLILSLGVPQVFASIEEGELDPGLVVAGYIVMRLGMLALWLRVAVQDPVHRRTALAFAGSLLLAQLGWVALGLGHLPLVAGLVAAVPLYLIETVGPIFAENRLQRTPWHPHHIAERYGLLVIITLGEVVLGTATTISAIVQESGWTADAAIVGFAGTALAFALWWMYFMLPSGVLLARFPRRGFVWGYGHIVLFGALVATGAGLDVAALTTEGESHLTSVAVALAVAVPTWVLLTAFFALYSLLIGTFDPFHLLLYLGALVMLAAAVGVAAVGLPLAVWLSFVVLAPVVVIVGYETVGYRHQAERLAELDA
ncbi:low temperature requirement protein A [Protaetiibacter intestinalis]|uniref:Low temperature requirement protein A n=1 Tax=Protaetiibacter intestinalis TaxID=2419774 RepID=A0A387BD93_9MICO|nr:low temperature requirement protein A [Protaetiibacter intestinalis]AYF98849.1 low temperature requirement protein A [Protaetiibacter intestinalis]